MSAFWGALTADLVGVILGTLGFWTGFTGVIFIGAAVNKIITVRRDRRHRRTYDDAHTSPYDGWPPL
jgi:4-hydroxybenzoate polyprenyltransferase